MWYYLNKYASLAIEKVLNNNKTQSKLRSFSRIVQQIPEFIGFRISLGINP